MLLRQTPLRDLNHLGFAIHSIHRGGGVESREHRREVARATAHVEDVGVGSHESGVESLTGHGVYVEGGEAFFVSYGTGVEGALCATEVTAVDT